ncbi:MAG TPA: type II toxin-antitoxin system RelE/ParE family toxin [Solirubrobacterales bacterium]|nr:type II toxin-antitoxin system RelE/ParE family toxin [Solirubrobacterales bacterium]
MPELVLTRRARRELLDLSRPLADAVENSLAALCREPLLGHPLRGRLRGLFSWRVGAYRILYQLIDGGKTIRIVAIRHRSMAYETDPR